MKRLLAPILETWHGTAPRVRRLLLALGFAVVILVVALATTQGGTATVDSGFGSGIGSGFGSGFATDSAARPGHTSAADDYSDASSAAFDAPTQTLMVHVVGCVLHPGVYQLEADARVLDAIFAAGGFNAKADQASINLARPVNDGEQIVVLAKGSGANESTAALGSSTNQVNVNLADVNALDSLPGIGPTLAARIVDYRKANGGFTRLSDLGKVSGIGKSLQGKLQGLVTF